MRKYQEKKEHFIRMSDCKTYLKTSEIQSTIILVGLYHKSSSVHFKKKLDTAHKQRIAYMLDKFVCLDFASYP